MNTLIENVNYVVTYTDDIKDALREQGEEVPAGDGLSTLAGHVRNINKKTLFSEYILDLNFPYLLPDFENYVTVYDIDGNIIFEQKLQNEAETAATVNNLMYSDTFYRVNVWSQNINDEFDTFEWFVHGGSYITDEGNEHYFQIKTRGPLYQDLKFTELSGTFLDSTLHTVDDCNFINVKNFYQAFRGCRYLHTFYNFVNNAESFYFTFAYSGLTYAILNTLKCKNFNGAFYGCSSLETIMIDLTAATDVGDIFKGCTSLSNICITGGFGDNTQQDLEIDLTDTLLVTDYLNNKDMLLLLMQQMSQYNGSYTRSFKVTQTIYDDLQGTPEYNDFTTKGYNFTY